MSDTETEVTRRFTKIRHSDSDGSVQLAWEERSGVDLVESSIASVSPPEPQLIKTLRLLKDEVLRALDLPKEYGEGFEVYQVNISYKNETRGITITGKKKVSDLNSPFVVTTPYIRQSETFIGGWSSALAEAVATLEQYANAYVDGHRAQQELPLEGEEEKPKRRGRRAKQEDIVEQSREPVIGEFIRLFEDNRAFTIGEVTSERVSLVRHDGTSIGFARRLETTWNAEKNCWVAPRAYPVEAEVTVTA